MSLLFALPLCLCLCLRLSTHEIGIPAIPRPRHGRILCNVTQASKQINRHPTTPVFHAYDIQHNVSVGIQSKANLLPPAVYAWSFESICAHVDLPIRSYRRKICGLAEKAGRADAPTNIMSSSLLSLAPLVSVAAEGGGNLPALITAHLIELPSNQ